MRFGRKMRVKRRNDNCGYRDAEMPSRREKKAS
jgi:hypothetical protein